MIKNIGGLLIYGIVLISAIFGCKKEDVVLQDPTNFTRPINLALPLINTKLSGIDMFEEIDSLVYFFTDDQGFVHAKEGYTSEAIMKINFDIKRFIKSEETLDYLDELNIYIDFNNELPLSGEGQIYALDSLGVIVDSIFTGNQLFFEALISNSTDVPEPLITPLDINLSHDQIQMWYDESVSALNLKIISTVGGTTADPNSTEFIVFSPYSTLGIKLSIELKSSTTSK